jgi:hypothetical protein
MRRTRRKRKRRVKTSEETRKGDAVALLREMYTAFSMYMIISHTLLFDLSLLLCAFFFNASKNHSKELKWQVSCAVCSAQLKLDFRPAAGYSVKKKKKKWGQKRALL